MVKNGAVKSSAVGLIFVVIIGLIVVYVPITTEETVVQCITTPCPPIIETKTLFEILFSPDIFVSVMKPLKVLECEQFGDEQRIRVFEPEQGSCVNVLDLQCNNGQITFSISSEIPSFPVEGTCVGDSELQFISGSGIVVYNIDFGKQVITVGERIACIEIFAPVCGVDGMTYPNACFAGAVNIAIVHDGECSGNEGIVMTEDPSTFCKIYPTASGCS